MSGRRMTKAAAAAALAAAALAGCGDAAPKAGAAALVGDERIEISTLGEAVRDWRREFRGDPNANRIRAASGDFGWAADPRSQSDLREALDALILIRVAREAARVQGVAVSEGRVDQVVAEMNRQAGAASYVRAEGLPARYARDWARLEAVVEDLAKRFGATDDPRDPRNAAAARQVRTVLGETARGMRIRVNPRFGSFDPARLTLGPVTTRLSATDSGIR